MSSHLPLLASVDTPLAWWRGAPLSRPAFIADVRRAAQALTPARFAVNLCEDRYLFLVALAAVLVSGKTSLLPPSRAPQAVRDIAAAYPDNQTLRDADIEAVMRAGAREPAEADVPLIPADQVAVVVFTSGSTGQARAHAKRWGDLVNGAHCADRRFEFRRRGVTIVATVPPQHMYGLETSVMVPLACGVGVVASKPFYAEDIRAALAACPAPRALITTPIHLRVCVESRLAWPALEFIISATAPLSDTLAAASERVLGAPALEIYGCTEAGSIASRRRLDGALWRAYDGATLTARGDAFWVRAPYLPEAAPLSDVLILHDDTCFELAGRQADLVRVAGKRASLGDLNLKLNDIEGVQDAVFVAPEAEGDRGARLCALVVAPALSERAILSALSERIDPAFMPRPLHKVERLPRDALGKLPRAELLALVRRLKTRA
ncbi:MAG: AMP-binding protein [Gammaproteobacteria bacterium]